MPGSRYKEYIQLRKTIDQFYHRLAVERALPDSVLFLSYSLCEAEESKSPSELYAETGLSKQTGHSALMWLESRGFVERIPAPGDRRSKLVVWTEAGSAFADEAIRPLLAAEEAGFATLSAGDQDDLIVLTEKMFQGLKAGMEEMAPPGKGR